MNGILYVLYITMCIASLNISNARILNKDIFNNNIIKTNTNKLTPKTLPLIGSDPNTWSPKNKKVFVSSPSLECNDTEYKYDISIEYLHEARRRQYKY